MSAGSHSCWIFEIGKVYRKEEKNYIEEDLICGAMTGWNSFGTWSARDKQQKLEYFSARGKLAEALDGLGVSILSTSKGVVSNKSAVQLGVGGELLCEVF